MKFPPFAVLTTLLLALSGCNKHVDQTPEIPPTELRAVRTPPPVYPEQLACAGIGGRVVLKVKVGPQGKPIEINVMQSSNQPALDTSAQDHVRQWEFKPATHNGQAITQTIQVPVTFNPPKPKPDWCFALEESHHHE
ncbi:MAG TPA: energy transducer TonB [Xylella sp.]